MRALLAFACLLLAIGVQGAAINFNTSTLHVSPTNLQLRVAALTNDGPTVLLGAVTLPALGFLSVDWYGAVGDGVADDTAEIQATVDAASSSGINRVNIPPGTYLVSSAIQLPSNMALLGSVGTVLRLANGANTDIIRNADWSSGNTNIHISGLKLNGNRANQVSAVGDGPGQSCISLVNVQWATVERVVGHSAFLHGIDISVQDIAYNTNGQTSSSIVIRECEIWDCGDDGITTHACRGVMIENCICHDMAAAYSGNSNGIEIDDGSRDVTILGGLMYRNLNGILVKGHINRSPAYGVSIVGTLTQSNSSAGIAFDSEGGTNFGFGATVSGASFRGENVAVAINDYADVSIVGSSAVDCGKFADIRCRTNDTTKGIVINGCTIRKTTSYGIYLPSSTYQVGGVLINGCTFDATTLQGVFTEQPSVRIANSLFHGCGTNNGGSAVATIDILPQATNCVVENNRITHHRTTAIAIKAPNSTVSGNTVMFPAGGTTRGIRVETTGGTNTLIRGNIFLGNTFGVQIPATAPSNLRVDNNVLRGNGTNLENSGAGAVRGILNGLNTDSLHVDDALNRVTVLGSAWVNTNLYVGTNASGTVAVGRSATGNTEVVPLQQLVLTNDAILATISMRTILTTNLIAVTADDQSVSATNRSYISLSSDNGTAGNRTLVISSGQSPGHRLTLEWVGTNAGELVDDGSATGGGNVRLSATWTPTQYDTLELIWNGTDWVELARSTN